MKEKSRQKTYGVGSSMAQAELSYASAEFSHGSRYTVDCDSGVAEPEGLKGVGGPQVQPQIFHDIKIESVLQRNVLLL